MNPSDAHAYEAIGRLDDSAREIVRRHMAADDDCVAGGTSVHARGAVLVTSMVMLFMLTILGVTVMQVTRMQERMAGNTRDLNLAFQGAEAALRNAEALIRIQSNRPTTCSAAPCEFWDPTAITDLESLDETWWGLNAVELEFDGDHASRVKDMAGLARDPQFVVEWVGFIPDSLTVGHGVPEGRDFFQISGHSTGGSGQANAILQSTFVRRF